MWNIGYVGLGGFVGAVLRYGVMCGINALAWRGHWATLLVNVLGCAVIGALATRFDAPDHPARLFWVVGVLGGFTTFSTFSMDVLSLWRQHAVWAACWHIFLHFTLCLAGVWGGWKLYKLFE